MEDKELIDRILAYLRQHNTLTLATNGLNGPWAAALFYVNSGFDLYWLSASDTRHSVNIRTNPQVSIAIHEDYDDWRVIQGIQMAGIARSIGSPIEAKREMALFQSKFRFLQSPQNLVLALQRALVSVQVYHFKPESVWFIDNSKGFGHRDRIERDF